MISAVQKHECNLVEKFSYQSSVEDEPPQGKAEEPSKEKAAGADMEEDKRADNHQHMSKSPLHAPVENAVETKPEQAEEITPSNFKEDEDAEEPHLTCCDLFHAANSYRQVKDAQRTSSREHTLSIAAREPAGLSPPQAALMRERLRCWSGYHMQDSKAMHHAFVCSATEAHLRGPSHALPDP
ncbi:uncharacterized protein LOC103791347 isoform X14 [Callithrix jacchus]